MFIFPFTGFFKYPAKTGVTTYFTKSFTVLIITELPDNTGTSITNGVELIFTQLVAHLNLNPEKIVWIEHYPKTDLQKEAFDLVRFKKWNDEKNTVEQPEWSSLSQDMVEKIKLGINPLGLENLFVVVKENEHGGSNLCRKD